MYHSFSISKISIICISLNKHESFLPYSQTRLCLPMQPVLIIESISVDQHHALAPLPLCRELFSCEPLLYAAPEHCEVGVPVNVLHSRLNTHRHVPPGVQELQPKRVILVKLSKGMRRERLVITKWRRVRCLLFVDKILKCK